MNPGYHDNWLQTPSLSPSLRSATICHSRVITGPRCVTVFLFHSRETMAEVIDDPNELANSSARGKRF